MTKETKEKRNLTPQELTEYLEMVRLCNTEKWKSLQIGGNTALIPKGQEVAKTQEALSNLYENQKNNWLSHVLNNCGVPAGQAVKINSETGDITEAVPEEVKEIAKTNKK